MTDHRFLLCVSLIALLAITVIPGSAASVFGQAAPAEWTLMFYMDSDNDLERPQMDDLAEMLAVGSSAKINIVVLCDRNVKGDDVRGFTARAVGGIKNWTTAKLLVVEKGRLRELDDWGEVNMGDPATLKNFLQTVTKEFPAKRYGLVFGDHGSGWSGIVSDESAGKDTLDTVELPRALKEVTAQTGKFELIGFDACLMANFEAAKSIAPYARTMVGSEELEPGSGWDYTPLLTKFTQNPQIDGVALGKIIVNTYRDYYLGPEEGGRDKSVTLGVIDLGQVPALEAAVSNLGIRNEAFMRSGGQPNWKKTARARKDTETYGGDTDNFDLLSYAESIKRERPDAETVKAADAVIAAAKGAVLYKINGEGRPQSSGLSIFFPSTSDSLLNYGYGETPFSVTGKWMPFLAAYTKTALADTQAPEIEEVEASDADVASNDVITVTAKVVADDVAEADFVLAELNKGEQIIIGSIPTEPDDKGVFREEWDGSWFSISDGTKELICPISDFEELEDAQDTFMAEVPAQVRFRGTKEWRDVTLYFYLDFNEEEVTGEFVYAFEFEGNRSREVEIEPGDSIRPIYLSVSASGDTTKIAATDENDILNVKKTDDIFVGRADVAAGKYLIGFTITDFSDNTQEEFTEVTVQ
jgi:hypothetical protein